MWVLVQCEGDVVEFNVWILVDCDSVSSDFKYISVSNTWMSSQHILWAANKRTASWTHQKNAFLQRNKILSISVILLVKFQQPKFCQRDTDVVTARILGLKSWNGSNFNSWSPRSTHTQTREVSFSQNDFPFVLPRQCISHRSKSISLDKLADWIMHLLELCPQCCLNDTLDYFPLFHPLQNDSWRQPDRRRLFLAFLKAAPKCVLQSESDGLNALHLLLTSSEPD